MKYPVSSFPFPKLTPLPPSNEAFAVAQAAISNMATSLRLSPTSKASALSFVGILKLKPEENNGPE
ncbi:hypothetical protein D3C87_1321120 [compost metagenome]